MDTETTVLARTEIVFSVEGHASHFAAEIEPGTTVVEFAVIAAAAGQIEEVVEVFIEDGDAPLEGPLILLEHLSARFAPLHIARPGLIRTTVEYNGRKVERPFRPNVTIARVIEWAIGKDGLDLEGGPADYQLKNDGEVLSPDQHLGQVAHDDKCVELDLVFKIKPQG